MFNTLKVIGIYKQANKEKNLNIGTFIDVIFKIIDEDKNNKKDIIKEEISENILEIEISDKYICTINYKLSNNNYKDLGFLIRISFNGANNYIKGIITKYYTNEYILNNLKTINLYRNNKLFYGINPDDIFIFSDEFLNVSFIEIKNIPLLLLILFLEIK